MIGNDWLNAIYGGLCIGLAGGLLLLTRGSVMGVSGIVSHSLLFPRSAGWRIWFLLGLVAGPLLLNTLESGSQTTVFPAQIPLNMWQIVVGAFLVGIGTRIGSGCTSGHGICGIGRLSARSICATGIFMLVAMFTVYVSRHLMS